MIKKYKDIEKRLGDMRVTGTLKGDTTGFRTLDKIFTVKLGTYVFIQAAPHHGKSELTFEVAFNQALKFGRKSLIYSPETGSVEDIYAEFIHKLTGKPFHKNIPGSITTEEYYGAVQWIDEMFSIVDSDVKAYSFQELTEMVTDEEIIIAEPYNELHHDMKEFGSRQDLYIEWLIGEVRRYCKNKMKYMIITLHPANQTKEKVRINKQVIWYYPMPEARGAAGGQALLRKAMTWINMWRPPLGFKDQHGIPYAENEVLISVEKAKPKGVATKGIISLFFDWRRNRYFEKLFGKPYYAFEHEKLPESINQMEEPLPAQAEMFAVDEEDKITVEIDEDSPF